MTVPAAAEGTHVDAAAPRRLSLNQKTVDPWTVEQVVDACLRAEIPAIGLWREQVAEAGLVRAANMVRSSGLRVSSLCRGGRLTTPEGAERQRVLDDNRRAIDEAAELEAACLVLVVGGVPEGSRDLDGARRRVAEALAELVPYAATREVRLAVEPLHPMFCSDRAVISTLGQALDLVEPFPSQQLGVVIDTYHLWWDPQVWAQIERAGDRIACYQVGDWVLPLPAGALMGRGLMGDGCIDLRRFTEAVDAAGFIGDIEVEIFNAEVWDAADDGLLDLIARRFLEQVV